MDCKYYVRTTGERRFDYSPLKYEVLVDEEHSSGKHFFECLKQIKDEDAVLMEDDLVLCKNFQEEIEKVIGEHPRNIINFFTMPERFFSPHLGDLFQFNQCTYFPKGLLDSVIPELEKTLGAGEHKFYGTYLHHALKELGIPVFVHRPTLVQHIDVKSILTENRKTKFQTIYYKDYLDELGISLDEAYSPENKEKLKELLEADREKWKKEYGGET